MNLSNEYLSVTLQQARADQNLPGTMAQTGDTPQSHRAHGSDVLEAHPIMAPTNETTQAASCMGVPAPTQQRCERTLSRRGSRRRWQRLCKSNQTNRTENHLPNQLHRAEALKPCARDAFAAAAAIASTLRALNCILFGKQGLSPAQVKALLWQHEVQLASEEARGQQPGDTPTSSSAVQGGGSSISSSSKTAPTKTRPQTHNTNADLDDADLSFDSIMEILGLQADVSSRIASAVATSGNHSPTPVRACASPPAARCASRHFGRKG